MQRFYEPLPNSEKGELPLRRTVWHRRVVLCLLLACGLWLQQHLLRPRHTPARTSRAVTWDEKSLLLDGERFFVWSGEFHPWRLPSPHLWPDILQKMKAAGLNTVSLYVQWGMVNPAPGVFDWSGPRSLRPFLQMAQDEGLFVILRPGPYIQAETSAGGLPGWVTALPEPLRTNATAYRDAWTPYIDSVIDQIKPFEYTRGGPIIAIQVENEHQQRADTEPYLEELRDRYKRAGITVPLTINDADPEGDYDAATYRGNFASGRGSQDIYGIDLYPFGFSCEEDVWNTTMPTYLAELTRNITQKSPFAVPELQSGAFRPWGAQRDYAACRKAFGPELTQVFNLALWAENAKWININLIYGGTNWGNLPCPSVHTSYDYGAAITENRLLTPKYYELKAQGLFLRSAPSFASTRIIGDIESNNAKVSVRHLEADDGAAYYFVRQLNTSSDQYEDFSFEVQTSLGPARIPQASNLALHGHQAAVLVTDFFFGRSKLLYSTAPLLWAGSIGKRDVIVFTNALGPRLELQLSSNKGSPLVYDEVLEEMQAFTMTNAFAPDQVVLFLNSEASKWLWDPLVDGEGGIEESVLVYGPSLVRKARLVGHGHLALYGDVEQDTIVHVMAPSYVTHVSWNDDTALLASSARVPGGLAFAVPGPPSSLHIPQLVQWRHHDGLPERLPGFDDSSWAEADKTQTGSPFKPQHGEKVLYACNYGFCTGSILYRGHFSANDTSATVRLAVQGGSGMAASVWIDGEHAGSVQPPPSQGSLMAPPVPFEVTLVSNAKREQDHIITVLVDNMGQEFEDDRDTNRTRTPRGIVSYEIDGGQFAGWKIQGFLGGNENFSDRIRGIFNEGGSFGERQGWHLPGFDDSEWSLRDLDSHPLPAGIAVYRSSVSLDVPNDLDVPLQLRFEDVSTPHRVDIFVNGWKVGKRIADIGPQHVFPVPEGILDYHGDNTIVLFVWATKGGFSLGKVALEAAGIMRGGVGRVTTDNPPYETLRHA